MYDFLSKVLERFKKQLSDQEQMDVEQFGQPLDPHQERYDWLARAEGKCVELWKFIQAERIKRADYLSENMVLRTRIQELESLLEERRK